MLGFFTVGLLVFTSIVRAADQNRLDIPIIHAGFASYFDAQRPVRIDVSVCAANGTGEKALDFFLVDTTDGKIPSTLREILARSPFIAHMIKTFFDQGTETLMVTAMLSFPGSNGKVNNFIGINKAAMFQKSGG